MSYDNVSESLTEWEQIPSPLSTNYSRAHELNNYERVVTRQDIYNFSSNFPPISHEDLPISSNSTPLSQQPLNSSKAEAAFPLPTGDGNDVNRVEGEEELLSTNNNRPFQEPRDSTGNRGVTNHLSVLHSWIVKAASKVRDYAVYKVAIRSFTSKKIGILGVVFLVSLLYMKIQRRRRQMQLSSSKQLMLLIKEKDQKIDQLLLQICEMNNLLLARRKVQVFRVGCTV